MHVLEIRSEANFNNLIESHGQVVVDCWSMHCAPCKAFMPLFEQASMERPGYTFAKVKVEDHPWFASRFNLRSVPIFLFFKNGELIGSKVGSVVSVDMLHSAINSAYRGLK